MIQPSIYRLRLQDILAICVLSLLFLGVLMVQSAAMTVSGKIQWHLNDKGIKHLIFAAIALITFFAVGSMDYRFWGKNHSWKSPVLWMLLLAAGACVAVLVPRARPTKSGTTSASASCIWV